MLYKALKLLHMLKLPQVFTINLTKTLNQTILNNFERTTRIFTHLSSP